MFKKTGLALALSVALAGNVAALGLGEIDLDSALNQPFEAEIALLNTDGLAPEDVVVALASQEDYDRAGVRRLFFHTGFEFEVVRRGDGLAVVVTSESAVVEPFVDFLVQVRWPQGRLLRAYTVLLDLPALSGQQSIPVPVVKSQGDQAQPTTAPDPRPVPSGSIQVASPAAASAAEPSAPASDAPAPGSAYTVSNGETLWGIGSRLAASLGVQPQQAMVAIHRDNPAAFINGDINMLRRGAVLRLPAGDSVRGIGFDDAVADIQNRLDSAGSVAEPTPTAAQAAGATQPASPRPETDPGTQAVAPAQGRLELAAMDNADPDRAIATGNAGDSLLSGSAAQGLSSEVVGNDLGAMQEELDLTRLENQRMAERLAALEAQVADQQRLLELQSEELREAQLLAEPQTSNSTAAGGGSWMDAVRENLLWIGLVIVAGLLAIGLALRGKRREDASGKLQEETGFRNYAYAPSTSRTDEKPVSKAVEPQSSASAKPVEAAAVAAAGAWRASKRDLGDRESLDALLFGESQKSEGEAAVERATSDSSAETDDADESGAAHSTDIAALADSPGADADEGGRDEFADFREHVAGDDENLTDTDFDGEPDARSLVEEDRSSIGDIVESTEQRIDDEVAAKSAEPLEFTLDDEAAPESAPEAVSEPEGEISLAGDELDVEAEELEVDLESERSALNEAGLAEQSAPVADDELPEFALEESDEEAFVESESGQADLDDAGDAAESAQGKLDLARAYVDMGDADGAIPLLKEVAMDGNEQQKQAARDLLVSLS